MRPVVFFLFPAAFLAALAFVLMMFPRLEPIKPTPPSWWAKGPPAENEDVTIRKFEVKVTDEQISDWRSRVSTTRFGEDLEDGDFSYGTQVEFLAEVKKFMLNEYDWRTHENQLKQYEHYVTKIEGLDVHYMRATPKHTVAPGRVLLMLHGWPGSVWEFIKVLPLLTDPGTHGFRDEDAFEVICPSLPGFGFSEAPKKKGFGLTEMARFFHTLMTRLGHDQYYVQGGDWGSIIGTMMAWMYPSHMIGLHLNMIAIPIAHPHLKLHQLAALVAPSLVLSDADRGRLVSWEQYFQALLGETGYLHIQATKPDTVAVGLNDSPLGLAAYILEKFSTWTNPENRKCRDGCLTTHFRLDDLLTNVMIYWYQGNMGSAVRIYKEAFADPLYQKLQNYPVHVPTGVAWFPHEIFPVPEAYTAYRYVNIRQFSTMPTGGHFAAMEQPKLLAEDIIKFARKVNEIDELGDY